MTTHNLATHLSGVMPKLLKTILIGFVLSLTVVLIIALAKISYNLFLMVLSPDAIVTNTLAEQILNFFLYFGFLGLISQYFRSGYHFPLRYFIYTGITAMVRLIIVDHESATSTILFAGAILLMVIALCLILYSDKVKNI
ncbi:MAG: phosphate-starvation-inducible protein PsiE [Haemophilus parahaemolyticus]|nr:phosphate-starvation-inducible protein PsiE [Haemophilus parahaemolyticus]MBS6009738.1 phosphate-starvation-inducible protein PsiE [Haemophilus parahaemolyticus]